MTTEMQNTPLKNYLRNKLHVLNLYLYADVALEESFPGSDTWNLPVFYCCYLLLSILWHDLSS